MTRKTLTVATVTRDEIPTPSPDSMVIAPDGMALTKENLAKLAGGRQLYTWGATPFTTTPPEASRIDPGTVYTGDREVSDAELQRRDTAGFIRRLNARAKEFWDRNRYTPSGNAPSRTSDAASSSSKAPTNAELNARARKFYGGPDAA